MNQLKLHKIIATTLITLSIHYNTFSMDHGDRNSLWNNIAGGASYLFGTTSEGLDKMLNGKAAHFEKKLINGTLSSDKTRNNHDLDWAVQELVQNNEMERLLALLQSVKRHNGVNTNLTISMSPGVEESTRQPLQTYYARIKQNFVRNITQDMKTIVEQTTHEHALLVQSSYKKNTELERIKAAIGFVHGTDPADDILGELNPTLTKTIKLTFNTDNDSKEDDEIEDSDDDNNDDKGSSASVATRSTVVAGSKKKKK